MNRVYGIRRRQTILFILCTLLKLAGLSSYIQNIEKQLKGSDSCTILKNFLISRGQLSWYNRSGGQKGDVAGRDLPALPRFASKRTIIQIPRRAFWLSFVLGRGPVPGGDEIKDYVGDPIPAA